jgi:signal transduction histidine kinase
VSEVGGQVGLQSCRIILPDGSVLADQEPARADTEGLPDTWTGGDGSQDTTQDLSDGVLTLRYPIQVPGRGWVALEVAADMDQAGSSQAMFVVTSIAAATLVLIVLLYRPARSRVAPYALIREALLAVDRGEADPEALKVSGRLGPEAEVWNGLVDRRKNSDQDSLLGRALESAASGQGGDGTFELIGDALWHGLVLVDSDMRITYTNGAAAVLMISTREAMVEAGAEALFDNQEVVSALRRAARGADRRRHVIESDQAGEGRTGVLRFSVRPAGSSGGLALVVIEDITQQRVAEDTRRNFVAQVAHELRTPLTNISLNVEAAVDDGEEDAKLRGQCLNVINQETKRLTQLVNDMLSVSEIEAGSMKLRQDDIRLSDVFETLRSDFQQQAQDKQVQLVFNLPPKLPVIQGDRDKLVISLHNLLGNAVKYSPDGGEVSVSVEADDGSLSVAFKDKGIGIDNDELEKVFDRFYRAKDSRVSQITGTGLGLPIAREIVRRHGGDIQAASTLNQGSTFTITLPIKAEAA